MSEIEKLYENAGIYPDCRARECGLDYCANSSGCGYAIYPDFTAEKQLELIKWLIQKDFYDERIIRSNFEQTYFYCSYIDDYGDYRESEYFEKFEEALANVFNYFWQSLAPKEKQQIKEILE